MVGLVNVNNLSVTGFKTMYSILYFLIGPMLTMKKYKFRSGILFMLVGWSLVVWECTLCTNLNQVMYEGVNVAFPTLGALMLAVGVYIVSTQFKFKHIEKFLNFVAGGVLPIYLIHMCIIETFNHFVGYYTLNIALALIGAIIVCSICTLLGKIIQRIPVLC